MKQLSILLLLATAILGCAQKVPQLKEAVSIEGQLANAAGEPLSGVTLTLQPLEDGHMTPMQVGADGKFQGRAVPGKYAYFVKPTDESVKPAVDEKYLEPSLDRTVVVQSGENRLDLKLQ